MTPPMGRQLRDLVVRWRFEENMKITDIARRAGYSARTIHYILETYREFGTTVNPLAVGSGRPRHISDEDLDYILERLGERPTLYLDELQRILRDDCEVEVALSTISRRLMDAQITRKMAHYRPLQQNEEVRAAWQAWFHGAYLDPAMFVFLDESAIDERTARRTHGYSEVGVPIVERALLVRGTRYSLLPALSLEGVVALNIVEGSVNRERFLEFLRDELGPVVEPYPGRNSVIIMDNCGTHHDEQIRELIVDVLGAHLVYLPPYSPDLNPIEEAFSAVKAWLRRHEHNLVALEDLPGLIFAAAMSIEPEQVHGWFRHSGYV